MSRLILFLLLASYTNIFAQDYPKDFRPPMDLDQKLAGNFGELRGFHFHAGLDMKTNQSEGHNVYAIGDGYVSRIGISPRGYGKVIYINHPNGYTSVYAHLSDMDKTIKDAIKKIQYKERTFKIDHEFLPDELPVTKGQIIAKSGNTGSSGGPHLHFEVRETANQAPINPFHFGFDQPDNKAPLLNGMYVYAIDGNAAGKLRFDLTGGTKFNSPVLVAGHFGIGVKAYDKHNGANNMNGVYKIEVYSNDNKVFTFAADQIGFDETRYINSITDYDQYMRNKSWIYKAFKEPGNLLKAATTDNSNGIILAEPNETYNISIVLTDFAGNTTKGSFKVKGKEGNLKTTSSTGTILKWDEENYFKNEHIEMWLPKGSLYQDIPMTFSYDGNYYKILNDRIPLHKYFTLAIKPNNIPEHKLSKAVILVKYRYGGRSVEDYFPTEYANGKLVASVRDFGSFKIEVDETKPSIEALNSKNNSVFYKNSTSLKFRIKDTQTGIYKTDAYIDGNWVLTEYDKKNNLLTLDLNEENIPVGEHTLKLNVSDYKNNVATYTIQFTKAS